MSANIVHVAQIAKRHRSARHRLITGDCLQVVPTLDTAIDLVIADPPYGEPGLINSAINVCRNHCQGACFFFMYGDDIFDLTMRPDQILYWLKPPSTKNTTRRYSRFVEVIAAYDIADSPFNQDPYWYARSGIFTDTPLSFKEHPYTKPESLIEKLIGVNSNPGDTILDPFAGACTTAKVAARMDRKSISIEVVP